MAAHPQTPAELSCVVCGRLNRTRRRFPTADGTPLSVTRCRRCGHVYQCPQTDKSYARAFYTEAYGDAGGQHPYFDPQLKLQHAKDLLEVLQVHCPGSSRVLEVGAGQGAFVRVAQDAGLRIVGTELSEMAVRKGTDLFGVRLHFGPVEELPEDEPFDAAVFWDVIEHCPRPDSVLGAVKSRLAGGGRVLLTTGNYECAGRLLSGERWWCWSAEHYHYFSPGGMSRLGARLGFTGFLIDRVVRLKAAGGQGAVQTAKSPFRFLNPLHVALIMRNRALLLWARARWPNHWNIGVMLCRMTKPDEQDSSAA